MKVKETEFFKLLEFYQKCDRFRKSCMALSSFKTPIIKVISVQAFYILFCIYVIANPIRHIVTLIQYGKIKIHLILLYSFTIYFRICLSVFSLLKIFRRSKSKQLIEAVAEIENVDEQYSFMHILYSFKTFYAIMILTILSNIFVDFVVPCLNEDLLGFLTFPISTDDIFKISILGIQTALNSIPLVMLVSDLHLGLVIGFAFSYEYNKLTNEAESYATEKQSDYSNFITKCKDITEICNAHDILSRKVVFVNEWLHLTSGFVVVSSNLCFCIATYAVINGLLEKDIFAHLYISMLASGCFFYLILLLCCGIYLHKSVSFAAISSLIFLTITCTK